MPTTVLPRLAVACALVAGLVGLGGCAPTSAPAPAATVTVAIAPAAHPARYEVHLHHTGGTFRETHTMTSGETRTYTVPVGWLTVRIPGLCVVPTPNTGSTVVHVDPRHCRIG